MKQTQVILLHEFQRLNFILKFILQHIPVNQLCVSNASNGQNYQNLNFKLFHNPNQNDFIFYFNFIKMNEMNKHSFSLMAEFWYF